MEVKMQVVKKKKNCFENLYGFSIKRVILLLEKWDAGGKRGTWDMGRGTRDEKGGHGTRDAGQKIQNRC
jgi:hypothetical protein